MKTRPTQAMTLMADDVREETSGKSSIIGVYGNDLLVETTPVALPKLCFLTRLLGGEGIFENSISLIGPDGAEMFAGKNKNSRNYEQRPGLLGNIVAVGSPIVFPKLGAYTYTVYLDGENISEYVFVVKLKNVA